jgi:hypothetical protein
MSLYRDCALQNSCLRSGKGKRGGHYNSVSCTGGGGEGGESSYNDIFFTVTSLQESYILLFAPPSPSPNPFFTEAAALCLKSVGLEKFPSQHPHEEMAGAGKGAELGRGIITIIMGFLGYNFPFRIHTVTRGGEFAQGRIDPSTTQVQSGLHHSLRKR